LPGGAKARNLKKTRHREGNRCKGGESRRKYSQQNEGKKIYFLYERKTGTAGTTAGRKKVHQNFSICKGGREGTSGGARGRSPSKLTEEKPL